MRHYIRVQSSACVLGSPRIDYLGLNNCCWLNQLDIVSESLKKLVITTNLVGKIDDPDKFHNSQNGANSNN